EFAGAATPNWWSPTESTTTPFRMWWDLPAAHPTSPARSTALPCAAERPATPTLRPTPVWWSTVAARFGSPAPPPTCPRPTRAGRAGGQLLDPAPGKARETDVVSFFTSLA